MGPTPGRSKKEKRYERIHPPNYQLRATVRPLMSRRESFAAIKINDNGVVNIQVGADRIKHTGILNYLNLLR